MESSPLPPSSSPLQPDSQHNRSHLARPPSPLLIDDTLRLHERSNEPEFVDHAALYRGMTEEELTKANGGKLPWDHSLKSKVWLEQRAPAVIEKEWLEPQNKPTLGINGRVKQDFDKLDLKWLRPIKAPTNDEELEELRLEKVRQAKQNYAWGHEDAVMSVAFSPDGTMLASAGCDGRLCIWEYATAACLRNLPHHDQWVLSVTWSPCGTMLATASADSCVRVWRTSDWIKIKELQNVHSNWATVVRFLPSVLEDILGRTRLSTLISGSADRSIVVWGLGLDDWPLLKQQGHGSWVNDLVIRDDGIVASGSSDTKVRLWKLRRARGSTDCNKCVLEDVTELPAGSWVTSVCFMSDDRIAAATKGGYVCVWRVGDNLEGAQIMLAKIEGAHEMKAVNAIAFFEPYFVSAAEDKVVAFYDHQKLCVKRLGNGRSQRLIGHPGPIYGMSFDPTGTLVATCAEDCSVRVWNLASRVALRKFEHRQDDSWKKAL
jgi:WD40 repeat protein